MSKSEPEIEIPAMKKIWLGIELSVSFFEVIISPIVRFHLVGFLFGIIGIFVSAIKFCCFKKFPEKFGAKRKKYLDDDILDDDAEDPKK